VIAVLLVGGQGTRLRPLTEWLPKPMLPIANRPFLEHQIDHLREHGVERIILSCGYLPDAIRDHFGDSLEYAVEDEPLGTGGAVRYAGDMLTESVIVFNGDSLREADLGALAELRRGAGIGSEHVLFISGEVGVGGGLIVDGRPLTGFAGYGGEVGHMPVNADGRPCGCGSTGCWETEVGEDALLRRAGRPVDGGREAVDAVLAAAAAGDPEATAAVGEVGRWLGIGLAGLVNVLDPRLVVMGGHFARLFPLVREPLERELAVSRLAPLVLCHGAQHCSRTRHDSPLLRRRERS